MRSRTDYIITKSEVQQLAEHWLSSAFGWRYEGTKCTASVIYRVLLLAASRVVSVFAACRSLADAPCGQTIRDVVRELLPPMAELERRANRALVSESAVEIEHQRHDAILLAEMDFIDGDAFQSLQRRPPNSPHPLHGHRRCGSGRVL